MNTDIKCPLHTTGGGPCYCGHEPDEPVQQVRREMRNYTFTTASGGKISTNAKSMADAIRQNPELDIVSCKSEPIIECASREQAR